jgi:hypothetical protein
MKIVVGIFGSSSSAEKAAANLVRSGLPPTRIRQLTPRSSEGEIHSTVPISETEQSGMGRAIGGLVGAVAGAMAVLGLSVAFQPGALTTANYLFAALGAVVAGAIGAFVGGTVENRLSPGLPKDEIYYYEEALRRGRSVVFVLASTRNQERIARRGLGRAGADSLDAADESWRVGLSAPSGLHPRTRGKRAS